MALSDKINVGLAYYARYWLSDPPVASDLKPVHQSLAVEVILNGSQGWASKIDVLVRIDPSNPGDETPQADVSNVVSAVMETVAQARAWSAPPSAFSALVGRVAVLEARMAGYGR